MSRRSCETWYFGFSLNHSCLILYSQSTSDPYMGRQNESFLRRFGRFALLIALLPIILPLVLFVLTLYFAHRTCLYLLVWSLWLPQGKDVLLVYSDSPIWHDYMETEVLPLVRDRAVILNWSQRNRWPRWSFRTHVFHYFGGDRNFNPLVVHFRPFRRARTFRFWSAFKDWKHGHREHVEILHRELASVL